MTQVPGVKYVPMVGKVTVAMLERNLMRLFENYHIPQAPGKDFRYVLAHYLISKYAGPGG